MKKHFLILMLMALLPMVSWADIAFGTVEIGDYTYGNNTLPVPVVKDAEGSILTENTHYTVTYNKAYTDATFATEVDLKDMTGKDGSNTYYIKITGIGAYDGKTTSKAFVCNKKELTITVNNQFQRNYGSLVGEPTNAQLEWNAATLAWQDTKAGLGTLTYNYAGKGDVTKAGGEYPITFTGLASDNYTFKYPTDKVFTIVGADMTNAQVAVKEGTAFASKTYKGALFTAADLTGLQLTYGEAVLTQGTDFDVALGTSDAEGAFKNVGNWPYTINFKGNYSGTKANFGTFQVTAAPLSVDVDDIEVTYKGTAYTNDFGVQAKLNYYGFAASDIPNKAQIITAFTAPTVAVAAAAGATNASTTGYDLEINLEGAATNNVNYEFVTPLNTGKLIIKKKEVKFYAKSTTKGPGQKDPTFVLNPNAMPALVNGDNLDVATVTFTRAEGNEVGQSYDITPVLDNVKITRVINEVTTEVTANYDLQVGTPKGQLTINQAALTITIKDQSKEYGEEDPATIAAPVEGTNYIVTGLVSGDEITSLTLTKSWAAETANNYILNATVTVSNEDHYSAITVVPGNFEIKKAPLTVTLPIKKVTAGGTPAATLAQLTAEDITIEGFKKNEDQDEVADYELAFNTTEGENKAVLTEGKLGAQTATQGYELKLSDAIFANYAINGKQSAYGKLIVGEGVVDALPFTCVDADAATIAAKAGEKKNVTIKFAPRSGQTLGEARKWAAGEWNTLVLPFDITVAELSTIFGYAVVNVIDNVDLKGDKPVFKFKLTMKGGNGSETVLKANRPFTIKTVEDLDITNPIDFGVRTIVAPTAADDVQVGTSNIYFKGTYTTKQVTKNDNGWIWFLMGNYADGWAYIKSTSSATWNVVPFAGYIDMSAQGLDPIAASRAIFVMEEADGTKTAIKAIDMDSNNAVNSSEGWYNLNGMKMQGAPSRKGIYIQNGKKVVVK